VSGLEALGAIVYGSGSTVGVLSFNLPGLDSAELAYILDELYDISVRGGLHCCPQGHRSLGTLGPGTVRISPGLFNSKEDIEKLLDALGQVSGQMAR
jgi:selenocysteine lyase/cysteine desulfurase